MKMGFPTSPDQENVRVGFYVRLTALLAVLIWVLMLSLVPHGDGQRGGEFKIECHIESGRPCPDGGAR